MTKPKDSGLTVQRIRELVHCDPDAGVFTWIKPTSFRVSAGDIAGSVSDEGYVFVTIDGYRHRAHRLVWMWVHGRWPVDFLDHINGNKSDNRISNLREVSNSLNMQNQKRALAHNKCGFLGVHKHSLCEKWTAQIKVNGVNHYLGLFATAEMAHKAYLKAKRELHPACTI
jgi:hypothetical protein